MKKEITYPEITSVRFNPVDYKDGHMGFVSFNFGGMVIQDVGLHQNMDRKSFRLVYPLHRNRNREAIYPKDKDIQKYIEGEVIGSLVQRGELKIEVN